MASKEELYISVDPISYRISKSNILASQVDLLKALKHLHHLKVLSRQKKDLKIALHKHISTLLNLVESIKSKMPEPKIPKSIFPVIEKKAEVAPIPKVVDYTKRTEIDEELMKIQEKLKELNTL